jgi:hypothetical protein
MTRHTETEAETASEPDPESRATHVTISYPTDLSDWGRFQVEKPSFRAYLRRTLGDVAVGDVCEEFVGVGCCGNTLDLPLRIEAVEGGLHVDEDTKIEYTVREACGVEGSWRVQSAAGADG